MYMVFNIGCIECGVSSKIVGLFKEKAKAEEVRDMCEENHYWREHGQNEFEVFELPEPEVLDPEYTGKPQKAPTPEERVELLKQANEALLEMVKKGAKNEL